MVFGQRQVELKELMISTAALQKDCYIMGGHDQIQSSMNLSLMQRKLQTL